MQDGGILLFSLRPSHGVTAFALACSWLCNTQAWLSGPPEGSILMQAANEQYPKAEKKAGNPKEK